MRKCPWRLSKNCKTEKYAEVASELIEEQLDIPDVGLVTSELSEFRYVAPTADAAMD